MNNTDNSFSKVAVRCQFCERLFLMPRPVFTSEQQRATCPQCWKEAKLNTDGKRPSPTNERSGG